MAFTVEDGTGLSTANSGISEAEFNAYHGERGNDYSAFSSTLIEQACVRATDYFEQQFRTRLKGIREFTTTTSPGPQALSFPRLYLYDSAGVLVTGVATLYKNCLAEYAFRALTAALNPDPVYGDNGALAKATKSVVGPIEDSVEYVDGAIPPLFRRYPAADRWVREFLTGAGGTARN